MLNQDFKEFIQLLNDNDVLYLVVGGYAVAVHGYPHYTKDIDIWLGLNKENSVKIIKVLEQFGFASLGLKPEDFLVPEQVIQLGYAPNRIDLLTSLAGVDFKSCYESRIEVKIDQIIVNFIDLENLKKNKRSTGRLEDLADLERLKCLD